MGEKDAVDALPTARCTCSVTAHSAHMALRGRHGSPCHWALRAQDRAHLRLWLAASASSAGVRSQGLS